MQDIKGHHDYYGAGARLAPSCVAIWSALRCLNLEMTTNANGHTKLGVKNSPSPQSSNQIADVASVSGLASAEARRRLEQDLPMRAEHGHLRGDPEILGASSLDARSRDRASSVLGKYVEAAIIAALLVFNAALGFFQEGRAQATLAALKSRLALNASVRRDGVWTNVPAAELVPGDLVKLRSAPWLPPTCAWSRDRVLLDQSMLTGESMPIEAGPGFQTYAGALVRRGEAVAEVTATGTRTKFGRTAELVRTAHVVSSQQKAVLRVVRNLAMFNGTLIVILVAYAWFTPCRWPKSFPSCSLRFLPRSRWRCRPPLPLRRRSAHGLWQSWAFCRRASPPWTRRQRSMSCARIRPAR